MGVLALEKTFLGGVVVPPAMAALLRVMFLILFDGLSLAGLLGFGGFAPPPPPPPRLDPPPPSPLCRFALLPRPPAPPLGGGAGVGVGLTLLACSSSVRYFVCTSMKAFRNAEMLLQLSPVSASSTQQLANCSHCVCLFARLMALRLFHVGFPFVWGL